MNKRKFIEFVAAGIASPFLSSLLRAESEKELKNWAGNLEYGTNRLYPARSLEEVQSYVNRHALRLEQQVGEIFVATTPSKKGFDVAVDGFHDPETYFLVSDTR